MRQVHLRFREIAPVRRVARSGVAQRRFQSATVSLRPAPRGTFAALAGRPSIDPPVDRHRRVRPGRAFPGRQLDVKKRSLQSAFHQRFWKIDRVAASSNVGQYPLKSRLPPPVFPAQPIGPLLAWRSRGYRRQWTCGLEPHHSWRTVKEEQETGYRIRAGFRDREHDWPNARLTFSALRRCRSSGKAATQVAGLKIVFGCSGEILAGRTAQTLRGAQLPLSVAAIVGRHLRRLVTTQFCNARSRDIILEVHPSVRQT